MTNLYARLMGQGRDPARTAIETADGARWSYGDIDAAAARFANLILARGVRPGDRVAVQVEKSVESARALSRPPSGPAPSTCRSTPPTR